MGMAINLMKFINAVKRLIFINAVQSIEAPIDNRAIGIAALPRSFIGIIIGVGIVTPLMPTKTPEKLAKKNGFTRTAIIVFQKLVLLLLLDSALIAKTLDIGTAIPSTTGINAFAAGISDVVASKPTAVLNRQEHCQSPAKSINRSGPKGFNK